MGRNLGVQQWNKTFLYVLSLRVARALVWAIVLGVTGAACLAQAEVIQFPDEELATESVLPVFDRPEAVKERVVQLKNRFELGALFGYALTEPFYNPMQVGGTFSYHFNEVHAVNVLATSFLSGLSNEGRQLNPIPGTNPPINMNLQFAPQPKFLWLASYQYSGFYGKLSLTKDYVMNLHLYGLLGGGMYTIGDTSYPTVSFGVGQKFHFTPSFSLRVDIRALAYNGPNPTSALLSSSASVQPNSRFEERFYLEGLMNVGLSYTLPALW